MTNDTHDFDPFAKEVAYIRVNEKLIERLLKRVDGGQPVRMLDVAAATGLMTSLAYDRARSTGLKLVSTLLDIDRPALMQARIDVAPDRADYIFASAFALPMDTAEYDVVCFANSVHLLDNEQKQRALAESYRVLKPGGVIALNSTFYDGAYPEDSKPFYSRWIRRSIVEINRRLPERDKSNKVQAMEWLNAEGYDDLIMGAGFRILEQRERRVRLSQAAVRAISSYKEFAKGALHATDEDADEAAAALQATVRQTFNDLKMKFLARNWLELIAAKP